MNRQDVTRVVAARVLTVPDCKIDPASVNNPASAFGLMTLALSVMAEEVEARSVARQTAVLPSTARETDLDRVILDFSKGRLPRKSASAAKLSVYLGRLGTSGGSIPKGTPVLAGQTFTTDQEEVFLAGDVGPRPVDLTCSVLGVIGNVAPSQVSGFKTPSSLFDPTFTVSSVSSDSDGYGAGGAERERDADYRARYALWDAGLDRNIAFLAAGALTVPGIATATAIEDVNGDSIPTGSVSLYVGDVNGRANAALLARVVSYLFQFRLPGQHVVPYGTSPDLRSFVLHFAVDSGFVASQVQASARAAYVRSVNSTIAGRTLQLATGAAALKAVPGVVLEASYPFGVVSINGTTPTDVAATTASTVFRTSPELVTFG